VANSDTILALNGFGSTTPSRNQLASLTGLGTVATLLTMGSDTSGTYPTAFIPIPGQTGILGASNPLSVNVNTATMFDQFGAKAGERGAGRPWYNQNSFDGRSLRVRLQGRLTSSAASNGLTCIFYINTAANGPVTAGAGTLTTAGGLASAASLANATSYNCVFETTFEWDSVSAAVVGSEQWGNVGGLYISRAVGNATPYAVAAPLAGNVIFASIKFATGATNVFTPTEFAIEDV